MSPSVRLVCHPDVDGRFSERAALTLRIDLPGSYSAEDVVKEIQQRLRETYPLATIRVEAANGDGDLPVWHVHRDGVKGRG
jgi:hypothetical protein